MREPTARWILRIAGIYGLLVIVPGFFSETQFGVMFPPVVTHPEMYYGFYCVALAWQVAFLVMANAPATYRLLLLPAMIEKGLFPAITTWLFLSGRLAWSWYAISLIDAVFLVLFIIAFSGLRPSHAGLGQVISP